MKLDRRQHTDPVAFFAGKTREELKLVEYCHQVLMPDAFRRQGAAGPTFDPCWIRVPRETDLDMARIDAIAEVARITKDKSIRTVEAAQKAIGPERFENLDTSAIVARCAHEPEPPKVDGELPQQFMTLEILRSTYLFSAIYDVFEHMDILRFELDPRFDKLTEEQFWLASRHITEKGTISPLGAMRGDTQRVFVVEACRKLWDCRMRCSCGIFTEMSTPA